MSEEIKAGLIMSLQFVVPGEKLFSMYINYIDREAAVKQENDAGFHTYLNYMDDRRKTAIGDYIKIERPIKTSELFTATKDKLTPGEKLELKRAFSTAQENQSILWQPVISFDNRWLELQGLYDAKTKTLDEGAIRCMARASVETLLRKEKIQDSAVYSAAIHYNTDNIHVHIAIVEPHPTRELKEYQGEMQRKGMFQLKHIEQAKVKALNKLLDNPEVFKRLDHLLKNTRDHLTYDIATSDQELADRFQRIIHSLPGNRNKWNYKNLKGLRPQLDELTDLFMERHRKEDLVEMGGIIGARAEERKLGLGLKEDYRSDKLHEPDGFYQRMGNQILDHAKTTIDDWNHRQLAEKKLEQMLKDKLKGARNPAQVTRIKRKGDRVFFASHVRGLLFSLNNEMDKIKNEYEHERLMSKIDHDHEI